MGNLGGPLGLNGGAGGSGYQAPSAAAAPETLKPAMQQQQELLDAMKGQGAMQKQGDVYGQMQGLAGQYQGIAAGTGPNPAQAMLSQRTGENVQNQAALMAGQRGAGANVGLMARQAGMAGGNLQQQAVGQGATMQANQSLAALGQVGNTYGQAAGMANTMAANRVGQTNANVGSNLNMYQQEIAKQANLNQGNAALALQSMQQGQSAVGSMMGGGGSMMSMMGAHGGQVRRGYDEGGEVTKEETPPEPVEVSAPAADFGNFTTSSDSLGSYSIPNSATFFGKAAGGEVSNGPQSEFGQFIGGSTNLGSYTIPSSATFFGSGGGGQQKKKQEPKEDTSPSTGVVASSGQTGMGPTVAGSSTGIGSFSSGVSGAAGPGFSSGGGVNIVVSPDEKIVPPNKVSKAAGGNVEAKTVPGKAKVSGDSYSNDTVPMKVPPGSIVIPRTSAGNEKDAAAFVRSVLAKRGRK